MQVKPWLLRLLMAVLLLFGSEILLWTDPPGRAPVEWLVLIPGYLLLGALLLDLIARYRARSIYEVMMAVAVYGICNGLILNPDTKLDDFPRTLATRIIGAHTLLGLEMFGLLLVLTAGHIAQFRRLLLGFSLWVGFYWGIWVRWSPSLTDWLAADVSLGTMFAYAGVVLVVALVVFALLSRAEEPITLPDLRLSPLQFVILLILLLVLLLVQILREALTVYVALPAGAGLIALCVGVLWFRRGEKSRTVLDYSLPVEPLSPVWIAASGVIFAVATVIAYHLPLIDIDGYNQLSLMEFGFAGVGFLWFPVVLAYLGGRALDRQTRKLNL